MPDVSVIIVSYGPVDVVAPCLVLLKEHCDSGFAELILVDNASPGFSPADFRDAFPWVRLIASSENRGFSAGNNLGIRQSRGGYILLLNPDTRVPRQTLPEMVGYMEKNPEVGAATCRVNLADGNLDPACHRGFPTPWTSLSYSLGLSRMFPRSRLFGRYHLSFENLDTAHEIDSPSGCFFLVRRTVVETVGLLDETFFMYGEDLDWAMRIKQAGWRIMFCPDVSIEHLKGVCSGIKAGTSKISTPAQADRERAYHAFHESMRIFYRKHYESKHPSWLRHLVFSAIDIRERLGRRRMTV